MSRLFLDTNILLDLVSDSRPHSEESAALLAKAIADEEELVAGAGSLKDVYYVLVKATHDEPRARRSLALIRGLVTIASLTDGVVARALSSDEPDFEDGIVRASAEMSGADLIVTHDRAAFATSAVPKASALEALDLIGRGRDGRR